MNEVVKIVTNYVKAIEKSKSPPFVVANIRSFIQYLKSPSLHPMITHLKEQKYDDLRRIKKNVHTLQKG
jgi:hypothetical protein